MNIQSLSTRSLQTWLKQQTDIHWCPIPAKALNAPYCAVAVKPEFPFHCPLNKVFFVPESVPRIHRPTELYRYMKRSEDKRLIHPQLAIKYGLDGIEVALPPFVIPYLSGETLVISGKAALNGEIYIASHSEQPNLTLTATAFRQFDLKAQASRNEFLSEFAISGFDPLEPTFSISNQYASDMDLPATEVKVTGAGDNLEISANYEPSGSSFIIHKELFTLEINIGYTFYGVAKISKDQGPPPVNHNIPVSTQRAIISKTAVIGALLIVISRIPIFL